MLSSFTPVERRQGCQSPVTITMAFPTPLFRQRRRHRTWNQDMARNLISRWSKTHIVHRPRSSVRRFNVGLCNRQVSFNHFQATLSEKPLQRVDVSPISQEHDGKRVSETMRMALLDAEFFVKSTRIPNRPRGRLVPRPTLLQGLFRDTC